MDFYLIQIFAVVLVCQFLVIAAAPTETPTATPIETPTATPIETGVRSVEGEFGGESALLAAEAGQFAGNAEEVAGYVEGIETEDRFFGHLGHRPFGHLGGIGGLGVHGGGYGGYGGGFNGLGGINGGFGGYGYNPLLSGYGR